MNVTNPAPPPPYTTPGPIGKHPGSNDYFYVVGFFCTTLLLLIISYTCCKSCKGSRSPPDPTTTYNYGHNDNNNRFSQGLDDHVIVTFPTYVYSEITTPNHKTDTATDTATDANGSTCSICLEDYKPVDVVRLFPECGHLFHVGCIDTWLMANATCPMCRNYAGINLTELT